jgi:hypothetical protein
MHNESEFPAFEPPLGREVSFRDYEELAHAFDTAQTFDDLFVDLRTAEHLAGGVRRFIMQKSLSMKSTKCVSVLPKHSHQAIRLHSSGR